MVVVTWILSIVLILYKLILILGVMVIIGAIIHLWDMLKKLKDALVKVHLLHKLQIITQLK